MKPSLGLRAKAELERRRRQRERQKQRVAPISFREFVECVNPRYRWYRHCEVLASVLQRVADGEIKRLMVFMPPRHSKSETVSRLFSAYFLYRYPQKWVGLTSYSAELAYTLSRNARENYRRIGGQLNEEAQAVKHWETGQGGGFWAAGVGGAMTGKGWGLGLIDDPIKNAEDAASDVIRAKQQDWYSSTFYTREEPWSDTDPQSALIVIQCMTGDTPVLMDDGTEIPLRVVKVGDQIATYDNGKLGTSRVLNHRSNHSDFVHRITMTSGKIVHANERHPFLVEEHGQLKWVRLKNLTTDHKIVIVRGNGASGKERLALPMTAKSLPSVEGSAIRTTKRRSGQMGTVRHHSTQRPTVMGISSIGTESPSLSMMRCLRRKTANALFANSPQGIMCALIGAENYASITATSPIQSEDFCATTVTSPWATPRQKKPQLQWSNTSDFTSEQIESIEPAGVEEVFDIQVERTENFIANGLVSHNTRWHEDDLSGWLLSEEVAGDEPDRWHIVNLPAIAEEQQRFPETCTIESDWREPGEALCPERRPIEKLNKIEKRIGQYFFDALFQQRPSAKEGEFFKVDKLETVDAESAGLRKCRAWDLAASKGAGAYTAGVLLGADDKGIYYVCDVKRAQLSADDAKTALRSTAVGDGQAVAIHLPQDPGQAGKAQAEQLVRFLAGFIVKAEPVTGSKETRAFSFAAQVNAGNVKMIKGDWNKAFKEELRQFPRGKYKDQVDSASDAFNELALGGQYRSGTFRR